MTPLNRPFLQRPAEARTHSRRTTLRPARRRRAPDYADTVVAAYIHEISTRTRHRRPAG